MGIGTIFAGMGWRWGCKFIPVSIFILYTGWPQKVSQYQMIKKSYQIVLKPVNENRFICQIQVWIDHYYIVR